jgi:L-methionine (R)-S-oxide reductase
MNKKSDRYLRIYRQIKKIFKNTDDLTARMATINALLYHKMSGFFWVGFYLLKKGRLFAGPYQGPLACTELEKNKGVCWTAINSGKTIIVPDVNKFEGHIACSRLSNSEIAVPVKNLINEVKGVLDIDSKKLNNFDDTDSAELEMIVGLLYNV